MAKKRFLTRTMKKATLKPKVYGQKENNQRDFAGLPLLRPAEGKRVDWMSAQGNDGYDPYGYDPEEYGYIKDGGTLPEVTVYGYYDSGDDG